MSLSSLTMAICNFEILPGVIFVLVLLACIVVPFIWCHVCNKSEARNVLLQPIAPQSIQPNVYPQFMPQAFHQNTGSGQNLSKLQIIYNYFFIQNEINITLSVVPNQYSHQMINETQNPSVAGGSLFGKLRKKLHGHSDKLETAEPYLNPAQRTEDV